MHYLTRSIEKFNQQMFESKGFPAINSQSFCRNNSQQYLLFHNDLDKATICRIPIHQDKYCTLIAMPHCKIHQIYYHCNSFDSVGENCIPWLSPIAYNPWRYYPDDKILYLAEMRM